MVARRQDLSLRDGARMVVAGGDVVSVTGRQSCHRVRAPQDPGDDQQQAELLAEQAKRPVVHGRGPAGIVIVLMPLPVPHGILLRRGPDRCSPVGR
jgi:hypothetical protein